MKNLYLFVIILSSYASNCYSQNWSWAKKSNTTTDFQTAKKVCTDNFNNVFVIGYQDGNATFGATTLNPGSFIAKYSSSGTFLWAKNIDCTANDVKTDPSGNVYILGNYLGTFTSGGLTMTSNGNSDICLVKYNSTGTVIWGRSYGGVNADKGNALQSDNTGNIYFTGSFTTSIMFDTVSLSGPGGFFLTKINSSGNVYWATKGLINHTSGDFICIDKLGTIYVTGKFNNPCMYCYGGYISKYDAAGNMLFNDYKWGPWDYLYALGVDKDQNVFVTCNTGSHYSFDPTLFKYDSLMNQLWYCPLGNSGISFPNNIVIDSLGNTYAVGIVGGIYTTDSITFGGQTIHYKGLFDIIIVKLDSAGNFGWIKTVEGTGEERPISIAMDDAGSFFITGFIHGTYSTASYDTVTFGSDILHNDGSWQQFFISKLDPTPPILTSISPFSEMFFSGINIYPNPSSGIFTVNLKNKTAETKICVYDVLGNCVLDKISVKNSNQEIDLSNQAKGIYFMEIISDGEKEVQKIVLQ